LDGFDFMWCNHLPKPNASETKPKVTKVIKRATRVEPEELSRLSFLRRSNVADERVVE
jgi:hypothetical protein